MQNLIIHWLANNWELILGYALNSAVTLLVAIPKTNAFWRVVKLLHGALDKIDPPKPSDVAKITSASLLALVLMGCSLFQPRPSQPCPGLYCIAVNIPGVPGSAKLCYDTDAERAAAAKQLEGEGKKVTVLK